MRPTPHAAVTSLAVSAILMLPGLRRSRRVAGRLRTAGAFPKTFVVDFDRH
ncbi:MAG: hypothetical protein IT182_04470 [Acidobacteria bacterium]|nr:hypothetical protein [Acidobacteriota bacterium]